MEIVVWETYHNIRICLVSIDNKYQYLAIKQKKALMIKKSLGLCTIMMAVNLNYFQK